MASWKKASPELCARFDPMGGRPMKGWWVVPTSWVADQGKMKELLSLALELAKELPAKVKKPAVKAKAAQPAPKRAAKKAPARAAKRAPKRTAKRG